MVESEFGNMKITWKHTLDLSRLASTVQAAAGIMLWGIFSWHTLGPLVPTKHLSNTTGYQQDYMACHTTQIISNRFLEHDSEFTILKRSPQSSDQIYIMYVCAHLTNLRHLCNVFMSTSTNSSEDCSSTLPNPCHEEIRQFWVKLVCNCNQGQLLSAGR